MRMPNRAIMGSMHMNLEEQPGGFTKLARFYAERAEGGAGLIVTEESAQTVRVDWRPTVRP